MTASRPIMFHELASLYDRFLAEKNYRAESERLVALARRYGRSGGNSWLDVGCGTGRHLEFLRRKYSVAGVDVSAEMLRVARHRLPKVRLYRADMRTFRLRRTFDVVSCLFGAIAHVGGARDVRAAFDNFACHLKPGGVVIVEPWIDPAEYRPGMLHLMTYRSAETSLARLSYSTRRGDRSVIHSHYLVGETGRGVRHLEETDDTGGLFSRGRLVEMMRRAGLDSRFVERGLRPGRGLLVGVKPQAAYAVMTRAA